VFAQNEVVQPLITRHGLCIVSVSLQGQAYQFLFDTGAPTVVSQTLAKRLKAPGLGTVRVLDALGNPARVPVVSVASIDLSGITVSGTPALVYEDDNPIFKSLRVDGILGSNALQKLIVSVSVRSNTIRFATAAPTQPTATVLDYSQDAQGSPFINLRVGGNWQRFLFDSGFEGLADLSDEAMQTLPSAGAVAVRTLHTENGYSGINGGGMMETRHVRLENLQFPEATLLNVDATVTGDSRSKIGAALFQLGDVTLDFEGKSFGFVPYRAD
jgi:predicted aspartyl protease